MSRLRNYFATMRRYVCSVSLSVLLVQGRSSSRSFYCVRERVIH